MRKREREKVNINCKILFWRFTEVTWRWVMIIQRERERVNNNALSCIKIKLPTGLYILVGSAITFIQQLKKAFYGIKGHFSHNEIKLLKMG